MHVLWLNKAMQTCVQIVWNKLKQCNTVIWTFALEMTFVLKTTFMAPCGTPAVYSMPSFDHMPHERQWLSTGGWLRLTHWGWVTHICINILTIIGSDNGLSPGRRQAIIWTNDGILLIWTLGTNFSEILSEIHAYSFKEMHLKMSSAKWRPFCLGLNVLT